MYWVALALILSGPIPDQMLIYKFKGFPPTPSATMEANKCFEMAADLMRHIFTYYGPRQFMELEAVFCITPPK